MSTKSTLTDFVVAGYSKKTGEVIGNLVRAVNAGEALRKAQENSVDLVFVVALDKDVPSDDYLLDSVRRFLADKSFSNHKFPSPVRDSGGWLVSRDDWVKSVFIAQTCNPSTFNETLKVKYHVKFAEQSAHMTEEILEMPFQELRKNP